MAPPITKVRVMRSFYFNRDLLKVGSVVDLPPMLALETIAAKKAEVYVEAPKEPAEDKPAAPAARQESKPVTKTTAGAD